MRLLALIPTSKEWHGASRFARLSSYRWLTRLGHVVSLAAVAWMSPEDPEQRASQGHSPRVVNDHGVSPRVVIDAPFAVRQLVRIAMDSNSHAILGVGDETVDSVARDACAALGIRFIDALDGSIGSWLAIDRVEDDA